MPLEVWMVEVKNSGLVLPKGEAVAHRLGEAWRRKLSTLDIGLRLSEQKSMHC
jgi:hypothetical protein